MSSPGEPRYRIVAFNEDKFQEHLWLQRKLSRPRGFHTCIGHNPGLRCFIFKEPHDMPPQQLNLFLSHVFAEDPFGAPWPYGKRVLKDVLQGIETIRSLDAVHTG